MTHRAKHIPPDAKHGRLNRRVTLLIALAIALTGTFSVFIFALAEGAEAAPAVSPTIISIKLVSADDATPGVTHPTRMALQIFIESGHNASWSAEYATSENGPWTPAGSGTASPEEKNEDVQVEFALTHLTPSTDYYVRAQAKNEHGEATPLTVQFVTPAIAPPELVTTGNQCGADEGHTFDNSLQICGLAGATVATFELAVYAGGAETSLGVEYSTSRSVLEKEAGIPIPGADGTVTVAEESANFSGSLSGLAPETTYYLRVKASNKIGTVMPIFSFHTTATPEAVMANELKEVTATSGRFAGNVNAREQETHWHFEYATVKEAEMGNWSVGPAGTIPAAVGDDNNHKVEGDLTGLADGTVYYVRLFAENAYGKSISPSYQGFQTAGLETVTTLATHAIVGESVRPLGVVSTSLSVSDPTHYHFEFVTTQQFERAGFSKATSTPEVSLSGGNTEELFPELAGHVIDLTLPVSEVAGEDLSGLTPGESYAYRVVGANDESVSQGAIQTLTVPKVTTADTEQSCPNEALRTGASAGLPDCRGYEQVTPPNKEGSTDMFTWGVGGAQYNALVGEDGEHVVLYSPFEKIGANSAVFGGGYFFSRAAGGSWQTTSLTPQPQTGFDTYPLGPDGLFNGDLTEVGFVAAWETDSSHSPEATYKIGQPGGSYTNVASVPYGSAQSNRWAGASANFHTLVLKTLDRKLLGGPATSTATGTDLYEYVEGHLRQLNVGSNGKTIGGCGARLASGVQGEVEEGSGIHAISSDGSQIVFSASPDNTCPEKDVGPEEVLGGPNWRLYVRVAGSSTVEIGEYGFLGANSDDAKLLLDKPDGRGGAEVFLYDGETQSKKYLFSVADYGELVRAHVSEDLSTIYFESRERLTSEAPEPGNDMDLYRYDVGSETLHFALVINVQESHNTTDFDGPFMSPDGRYFYWFSKEGNPGVPHPDKHLDEAGQVETGGSQQLYRYDGVENAVECVSCASPYDSEPLLETDAEANQFGDNSVNGVPRFRIASDDGDRVFFETPAALVPQDINGEIPPEPYAACSGSCEYEGGSPSTDVYEWRESGVDDCSRLAGCIALISGGREGLRTKFLGTTASGRDVFFATHESLVVQDTDSAGDIYDAREAGGEPPPVQGPVECEGDACATPFIAPSEITPSSASFRGAGNVAGTTSLVATSKAKTKKVKPKKKHKKKRVARKKAKVEKTSRVKHVTRTNEGGSK